MAWLFGQLELGVEAQKRRFPERPQPQWRCCATNEREEPRKLKLLELRTLSRWRKQKDKR
jgi:hypothetical protein